MDSHYKIIADVNINNTSGDVDILNILPMDVSPKIKTFDIEYKDSSSLLGTEKEFIDLIIGTYTSINSYSFINDNNSIIFYINNLWILQFYKDDNIFYFIQQKLRVKFLIIFKLNRNTIRRR